MGAMLKKYLLLSGMAVMLISGLAGCGNRSGEETSTNDEQEDYPQENHSNVDEENDQNKDINNDEDGEVETDSDEKN
ncbi:hypothetical protein RG959_21545 [Domibacillus sp. 8LH]|uniref:hypothetical protein n=1 Tax=unclassified Domibacillus TaxID=2632383 RepID=UPI0028F004BE|nr:hypothetical protein [Domibacillus sp. DTU_2020_1001157_1_SI_ALB_TIR_016]WNS78966.1 hypothetical protein RRU94_03220 [Domibacillus sp. DTU_2020_1001157_1_SI_ALB_TIR_016]